MSRVFLVAEWAVEVWMVGDTDIDAEMSALICLN